MGSHMDSQLHEFDPATGTDEQVSSLVDLQRAWRSELAPDDPQRPRERWIQSYRAGYAHGTIGGSVLATGTSGAVGCGSWNIGVLDNPQSAWVHVYVRPEARLRGLGRAIAGRLLDTVTGAGASDVTFCVSEHLAVGARLIDRVERQWGLAPAFFERQARLELGSVGGDRVRADLADRRARVPAPYELSFFEMDDLPPPETGFDMDDYASMVERIWNLMPLEELKLEDEVYTPETFARQVERERAQGRVIWNTVAIDRRTSRCVGVTNICFDPDDPRVIWQWDTGVLAEHQGFGLGKLLKLEMLARVLDRLPQALYIDTENAASNAAMIAINTALGFREHLRERCYQVAIDSLRPLVEGAGETQ